MSHRKFLVGIFAVLIFSLVAGACVAPAGLIAPVSPTETPTVERSVILSAFTFQTDNGTWGGESGPFINVMPDGVDVSDRLPSCQKAVEGTIYAQPVLVVAMGVGKVRAATCMTNILDVYPNQVKEVIWSGIAGISPRVGGVDSDGERLETGDVCIAYVARDWDRQYSSLAETTWWESSSTLEDPVRAPVGNKDLAEELYAASLQVNWPDVPEAPTANILKYHPGDAVRKAKSFYGNCAEVTGDNFWHGVPEDEQARQLVAALLNAKTGTNYTADQVFAITAMENSAWMYTVQTHDETIPFAYSRSASNFDQPWRNQDGSLAVTSQESITAGMSEGGGSAYGSVTAALPVLKMLELRATN